MCCVYIYTNAVLRGRLPDDGHRGSGEQVPTEALYSAEGDAYWCSSKLLDSIQVEEKIGWLEKNWMSWVVFPFPSRGVGKPLWNKGTSWDR